MRFSKTHLANKASKQDDHMVPPSACSGLRRGSSMTGTKEEVSTARPVVIIPSRFMTGRRAQSFAPVYAASLEQAREGLANVNQDEDPFASPAADTPATPGSPVTPTVVPHEDSFAFAFDIDGVLIRGENPTPEAIEAMRVLNGKKEFGVRIPYIFLTSGGGKTETERCIELSRQLDIGLSPSQILCGHTPVREMIKKYNTVLVIGGEGEQCRQVAEAYGFKDIVTPGDLIKDNENTAPFRKLATEDCEKSRKRNHDKTKVEAVFVFADSRDWAGDCQIILDLAMSEIGYIGTLSETFDEGPPIYFSHNDIVWSAAHENVRLGIGALRKIVETLFMELTHGKELNTIAFGKPQIGTFDFATRLFQQLRKEEYRINRAPETIYFVGGNPESDVRGTDQFISKSKYEWYSILVRTGVFNEATQPTYKPMAIVDTVFDAVKRGMKREFDGRMKAATRNHALQSPAAVEETVEGSRAVGFQFMDHCI